MKGIFLNLLLFIIWWMRILPETGSEESYNYYRAESLLAQIYPSRAGNSIRETFSVTDFPIFYYSFIVISFLLLFYQNALVSVKFARFYFNNFTFAASFQTIQQIRKLSTFSRFRLEFHTVRGKSLQYSSIKQLFERIIIRMQWNEFCRAKCSHFSNNFL